MTPWARHRVRQLLADAFFGAQAARRVGLAMRSDPNAFGKACALGYVRAWQYPVCLEVRGS